ncbi:hypothetical protein ACLF6K_00260 [Streptomyces xanthophaeus]|uniref:hypothetical protein n=1 Tax=Streptomyces xanthophaeus TaxID=67385 RepID=UPI00399008D1
MKLAIRAASLETMAAAQASATAVWLHSLSAAAFLCEFRQQLAGDWLADVHEK